MPTIRCSSLPILFACHASFGGIAKPDTITPEPKVDTSGPDALLGTACHEALAHIVERGLEFVPEHICPEVATRHRVDADDVEPLVANGLAMWLEIKPHVKDVIAVERKIATNLVTVSLSGHADLIAELNTGETLILDWKSGFDHDKSYYHQLMGYAVLVTAMVGDVDFQLATAFLRNSEVRINSVTKADVVNFVNDVEVLANEEDPTYSPGECCTYCPVRMACPGRRSLMRDGMTSLMSTDQDIVEQLKNPKTQLAAAEQVIQVHRLTTMLKRGIEDYTTAVKTYIKDNGSIEAKTGSLHLNDMKKLNISTDALNIIFDLFGPEQVQQVTDVSNGKLKKLIESEAPKGEKTRAWASFRDMLLDKGLATTSAYQALRLKKGKSDG